MSNTKTYKSDEVPTLLVRDSKSSELLCYLEQIVPVDDTDYVLLTPVDTPVCLFHLNDSDDPQLITTIQSREPILDVADVVLQEHDLSLIRSAVTLTVSGELDEPEPEELDDKDLDDDSELYELLKSFKVEVSCSFGFLIVVVDRSPRSIINCSNFIISFFELSLLDVII